LLAGLGVLAALLLVPVMFADRAPAVLDRISDRIENTFPDFYWDTLKPHFPEADVAMHLLVFGGAALAVGLICWSWRTFVLGQLMVFGAGLVVEVLQPVVTSSRNIELHDVLGNAVGQAIGIAVALVIIGTRSLWERRRAEQ